MALFMPAPQPAQQLVSPADRLLLVELSSNLYGSWGRRWRDCLQTRSHQSVLQLFQWVLTRALESGVECFIETVVDLNKEPHSYRLWLPMSNETCDQFVTSCAAAMPIWPEKKAAKQQRVIVDKLAGENIKLKRDVESALTVYSGSAVTDVLVTPLLDNIIADNHILRILGAIQQFTRQQNAYEDAGVQMEFRTIHNYVENNGHGKQLVFPQGSLVVPISKLQINSGDELLNFMLPLERPSEDQIQIAQKARAHATNSSANSCVGHALRSYEADENFGALTALLEVIYPVMEHVKVANKQKKLKDDVTLSKIAKELDNLFSVYVSGVPTIFCACRRYLHAKLSELRGTDEAVEMQLCRRMFFRHSVEGFTHCGALLAALISGVCGVSRLMPAQQRLWLLLYLRSHKIACNTLGSQGFFICCGPPETGKSKACQFWLACLPDAMVQVKDVVSAKSFTAMDENADLRAVFRDEMHELACKNAKDDPNTRAQQTLTSNGIIMVERLMRDEESGEFILKKTPKAGRVMTVTCTNNLNDVPAAIISRATVVAVPATKRGKGQTDTATLASIGTTSANALLSSFTSFCQTLASMQGDFWSAEAAGIFDVDDRMVLVYRLICVAKNMALLSARKITEVRHMATSIMALDICSQWYRGGVGALCSFDKGKQLQFFRDNAYVKMEHVLAAVSVSTMTTNVDHELEAVQLTLRAMIQRSPSGQLTPFAADPNYFEINTSRRRIMEDVADRNPDLGPGLAKTLVKAIQRGTTNGKQNLRYMNDELGHEHALIYAPYIAKVEGRAERVLLSFLAEQNHNISWDGEYYVFKSHMRHMCSSVGPNGIREQLPEIDEGDMTISLAMLNARSVLIDGKPKKAWIEADKVEIRRASETSAYATELDGKTYIKQVLHQVLLVHKSLMVRNETARQSMQMELFQDCLAIAGGYEDKTIAVGIGPNYKGAATVTCPTGHKVALTVANPLGSETDLSMLLGNDSLPGDSIFHPHKPFLQWSHTSNLEEVCRSQLS